MEYSPADWTRQYHDDERNRGDFVSRSHEKKTTLKTRIKKKLGKVSKGLGKSWQQPILYLWIGSALVSMSPIFLIDHFKRPESRILKNGTGDHAFFFFGPLAIIFFVTSRYSRHSHAQPRSDIDRD